MQIARMFERDIARPINGVVKVNQTDEAVVFQELDEYVVTKEVLTHLRKVFAAYCASLDHPSDKVGVWVSGFFGSGKSHFIKILSYLFENRPVASGGVTRKPVEFFEQKITDSLLMADIKRAVASPVDVILFNIDSKANVHNATHRDTVLEVFMKVFNERQGFCAEIPARAEMEHVLSGKNLFEPFKAEFQRSTGATWESERDTFPLAPEAALEAFAKVTKQSLDSARKWYDNSEKDYKLSVEKLATLVAEYLASKGPKHRIIFLVDEVGQYIGQNTQLMLNLQTITENLGTLCKGQAWVAVTSQEDMDAVLGEMRGGRANDFSKIQGRFNTRVSLSSANTDEVIRKRLLDKTPEASGELSVVYRNAKDILRNLLCFSADNPTLKAFEGEQDFIDTYPFVPYQFHLLQKVFESIRKVGASGAHLARGERSMLDSFQQAVRRVGQAQGDVLVPIHEFYAAIEGFLETVVVSTIKRAEHHQALAEFDIGVLKTLFLIRYVDLVKPNVENIATLCISRIDEDKLALRKQVSESLARLEKETLIQRNGDQFTFLTNEERDVMNEIKNVELDPEESISLLSELLYQDLLKDVRKHRFLGNSRDYEFNRLCDGVYRGASTADLSMEVVSPLNDDYDQWTDSRCIMDSAEGSGKVILRMKSDLTLGQEVRIYKQTEKYVRQKSSPALPESTKRILESHSADNRLRRERLLVQIDGLLVASAVFTVGRRLDAEGTTAEAIRRYAFDYLIQNTYRKLDYLAVYSASPGEAEAKVKSILTGHLPCQLILDLKDSNRHPNCRAILEIQDFLKVKLAANERLTVKDVADRFTHRPWGWPDWDTVILVAQLFRSGEIRFLKDGDALDFARAVEPMCKSRYWANVVIQKQATISEEDRKKSIELAKECFHETPPADGEALAAFIVKKLETVLGSLRTWRGEADYAHYPTKPFLDEFCPVFEKLTRPLASAELLQAFAGLAQELGRYAADLPLVEGFHTQQKAVFEQGRKLLQDKVANSAYYTGDAAKDWETLQAVVADPRPYNRIPKIKGLADRLTAADSALLDEKRQGVVPVIDKYAADLEAFAYQIKAPDAKRLDALAPLLAVKSKVAQSQLVDAILSAAPQAQAAFEVGWKLLESQPQAGPKAKPVVRVQVAEFAHQHYLETAEDVAAFMAELKGRLEAEIKAGNRVQVK